MTFQQLQYLLQVSRSGSISQAAKNLFVSQPSVSVAVSSLEEELGFPIFTRTQKGLSPTPEGQLVLEYAQRICSTHQLLTGIHGVTTPTVSISCEGFPPAHRAFSRLLQENQERTDISFCFTSNNTKTTMDKLASCDLDLGIVFTLSSWEMVTRSQMDELGLSYELLGSMPATIRIGPKHPLYGKKHLTAADFAGDRLLETRDREVSSSLLKGIIPIDHSKIVICENASLQDRLLRDGLGYGVGYQLIHQPDMLQYIPLGDLVFRAFCVTNPIRPLSPETQRYIELLKEELALGKESK